MNYESVNYVKQIITWMVLIVSAGGTLTATINALKLIAADDEGEIIRAKKNIKMCLIGLVVALSVSGLVTALTNLIG